MLRIPVTGIVFGLFLTTRPSIQPSAHASDHNAKRWLADLAHQVTRNRDSTQLLVALAETWNTSHGTVHLLTSNGRIWTQDGKPIAASFGEKGMAWGLGLHDNALARPHEPTKREGDRRSPAGYFNVGTAFGYAPRRPSGVQLAYRRATVRDIFVDDAASNHYNTWVRVPYGIRARAYGTSFEWMRRSDGKYQLGLHIQHNTRPIVRGRGSAIFWHIWRARLHPTAGCTAMTKTHLLRVLRWIKPDRHPMVIQLPVSVAQRIARVEHSPGSTPRSRGIVRPPGLDTIKRR